MVEGMTPDALRDFCLAMPQAIETFPFDERTSVFKTNAKIFALSDLTSDALSVSLKCDPEESRALRAESRTGATTCRHLPSAATIASARGQYGS